MGSLMDLIAGDKRDIVLALSIDDVAAFSDPDRFAAHLSLGGGLDPTWLDMFSAAVRDTAGSGEPEDFLDARSELDGVKVATERILERVDPSWCVAVGRVPDDQLGALAGRWIELLEEEFGPLPREEKPWIRDLAERIVRFARAADGARDIVFAWGF
jgi:hypothetical protein